MTTRRAVVTVSGRVQGVGFRYACRHEAMAAGVSGWVRNRADGTVEAAFEGPAAAVARVIEWCDAGPSAARVRHVDVRDETPVGEEGFRVR